MARTPVSRKRIAKPLRLARKMTFRPSVSRAATSSSPCSRLMAWMPVERGLANWLSSVFFTVPLRVTKKMWRSASSSDLTARNAAT